MIVLGKTQYRPEEIVVGDGTLREASSPAPTNPYINDPTLDARRMP